MDDTDAATEWRSAIESVADALDAADRAAALTGAGVSTASGIPDFRGDDGIWGTRFDPAAFHVERFDSDPAGFWADRIDLHDAMYGGDVAPNPAHRALAALEREGHLDAVVTQNTDGLHAAAGSEGVVELHGNAERVVCRRCEKTCAAAPVRERVRTSETPPRCNCGGLLKPDVVLFGERLPERTLTRARDLAASSDVFLAVGSSLTVEPAASLPATAAESGALVIVNLDATPYADRADADIRADVTDALPHLVETLADRA